MNRQERIPRHVAIIMDGNGRWAQQHGKERCYGHVQGIEPVRSAIRAAVRRGVGVLTLYAFSTENWGRPPQEVEALMELLCRCLVDETPELVKQGVRICLIGERSAFSPEVQRRLHEAREATAGGGKLTLVLALNYSARNEIARAARRLAAQAARRELDPAQIDEQTVAAALDTAAWPDPDLIVRTGGECRLSNFLLWQAAYAEFYFTPVLWPDFTEAEFDRALEAYAARERRFGLVK